MEREGVKSRRRRKIAYRKTRYVSDLILELMRERYRTRERERETEREKKKRNMNDS